MQNLFTFNIDVLGSCNLSCPSCPMGNYKSATNPRGFMAPELLDKILHKAANECSITAVGLFNWTEPLLHPQITELIRIVKSYNVPCFLSSNLNILKNPEEILRAEPTIFRISASGYNQSVYSITHRGGNIEKVKANMVVLAEAAKSVGSSKTEIHVLYHRYLGNLDDEILMKKFTYDLGFKFMPVWACMMPLEKNLAYIDDDYKEVTLTEEDLQLINRLALPLKEALEASQMYKNQPCRLRDREMTLDFMGNVQLCCGVYDSKKYSLKPFLETSVEQLQKMKYNHELCRKCMDKGCHVYGVYGAPELDQIAMDNLTIYYSQHLIGENLW